jgi:hypothetical protein
VRQSLANGVALDWPATGVSDVAVERRKLVALIQSDSNLARH